MLTGPESSLRWIAPEVLAGENPGLPSDIWSLGWVCWEVSSPYSSPGGENVGLTDFLLQVMTKTIPFPQIQRVGSISPHIVTGRLPPIQDDSQTSQVLALCNIMTECWKQKAERRPNAQHCQGILHWMVSPAFPPNCILSDIRSSHPPSLHLVARSGRRLSCSNWAKRIGPGITRRRLYPRIEGL